MMDIAKMFVTDIKGNVLKMTQSFHQEAEEAVGQSSVKLQSQTLQSVIQDLLALEKKTRNAADLDCTTRIALHIIDICYMHQDWDMLNKQIDVLCQRRGQLKDTVCILIKHICELIQKIDDQIIKERLMRTVISVTAGKVYVENERARVSCELSRVKLAAGNLNEALKLITDLQVESFSNLPLEEKVQIMLEQIRLCLLKKEYLMASIYSRKISTSDLKEPKMEQYLLKFYQMKAAVSFHSQDNILLCEDYFEMLGLNVVKDRETSMKEVLSFLSLFLILTRYCEKQTVLMKKLLEYKHIDEIGHFFDIITMFHQTEMIDIPAFTEKYREYLTPYLTKPHLFSINEFFQQPDSDLFLTLMNRLVEHNLLTASLYFSNISLDRLSQFVSLGIKETEVHLSELVRSETIFARIDGPLKRVCFIREPTQEALINQWAESLEKIMIAVQMNANAIHKENLMQNMIPLTSKEAKPVEEEQEHLALGGTDPDEETMHE